MTPILVNDPFLALTMTVNFPPWERFFDFLFQSYSFKGKDLVGEDIEDSVGGDLVNVGGHIVLRVRVAGVVRRKGFLRKLLEGRLLAHQFIIRQDWQPDLF